MARQISRHEDIFKILDELDLLSDPDDVLSEADEDFILQGAGAYLGGGIRPCLPFGSPG